MPALPSATDLRTDALTRRVGRREVAAFRRRTTGRSRAAESVRYVVIPVIGVLAALIGPLALAVGIQEELASDRPDRRSEVVVMIGVLGAMVLAAVLLLAFVLRSRRQRLRPVQHLRLTAFARENGLRYDPGPVRPALLGRLADRGVLTARSVVSASGPPQVEAGNLELITGTTGSRETRFAGCCAMRLPRAFPNLVLLARGRRSHPLTDAAPPAADQRLRLEGDFDRTFALHCPAGYEQDALYLLTPDVMARLLDEAGGWDVEVVDDLLVLSRPQDVVGTDPEAWRELAEVLDALHEKVRRWARWRDGRAASLPAVETARLVRTPAAVAAAGRRLRPGRLRALLLSVGLPLGLVALVLLSRLLDR